MIFLKLPGSCFRAAPAILDAALALAPALRLPGALQPQLSLREHCNAIAQPVSQRLCETIVPGSDSCRPSGSACLGMGCAASRSHAGGGSCGGLACSSRRHTQPAGRHGMLQAAASPVQVAAMQREVLPRTPCAPRGFAVLATESTMEIFDRQALQSDCWLM